MKAFCGSCGSPENAFHAIDCERNPLFEPAPTSIADPVKKPEHYNWHPSGVECKDIAEAFNYYLGNAIKYIWRADHKGKPIEDLQKARNCIDLELQRRAKR